jgi:hypothetical protein
MYSGPDHSHKRLLPHLRGDTARLHQPLQQLARLEVVAIAEGVKAHQPLDCHAVYEHNDARQHPHVELLCKEWCLLQAYSS